MHMMNVSIRGLRVTLLVAIAFVVVPVMALAQGATGAGSGSSATHGQRGASKDQQDWNRKFQQLSDSLKLTEEQSPKVRSIMEAQTLKAREIKTKFKGTPDTPENRAEIKKAMDELESDTNTQLVQVLSPAQMAKKQKMHDEEVKKMKEKEKGEKGEKESEEKSEKKGDDHR
jgi:Spy/CpxP family protein refolding chaperone